MTRKLLIANAVLTIPFGVIALAVPRLVFAGFGLDLDHAGELVARGYAATCLGYGSAFALLQRSPATEVVRSLLIASLVFNGAETVLQTAAAIEGIASPFIWGMIGVHALVAILSAVALRGGATAPAQT